MAIELPPNEFKLALGQGAKQIGFWLTLASPAVAEIAAEAGFDWVLIDMEHSPNDLTEVLHQLRASVRGRAEPVVRVPELNPVLVKRLLDIGVRSFMFPNIVTAEQARIAVASTRYPPQGIRGVAGTTRASFYGRAPDYLLKASKQICIIVQLESGEAISNARDIAAVEGIDGLFIGPNDLAANLGHLGNLLAPEVVNAVSEGLRAIRSSGKSAGILDFNPASAKRRFADGFGFIAVGGDGSLLAKETTEMVNLFDDR